MKPSLLRSHLLVLLAIVFAALPVAAQQGAIRFVENRGQIVDTRGEARPDVLFTTGGKGMRLYLRKSGISYVHYRIENLPEIDSIRLDPSDAPWSRFGSSARIVGYRMDMELLGSNPDPAIVRDEAGSDLANYYLAHCRDGILGVRSYGTITYRDVYPHIDLVFHSAEQGGMKYDFIVRPGGDVSDIRMRYFAAESIETGSKGEVTITTPMGSIEEGATYSYQDGGSGRSVVESSYIVDGESNIIRFAVGEYDRTRTLVIDPVLSWSTLFGGSDADYEFGGGSSGGGGWSMAMGKDTVGNIVVAATTASTDFPATTGAFQTALARHTDAAIIKLNPTGGRVWATYVGDTSADYGASTICDRDGNIFLTGLTSSTQFPVTAGAYQPAMSGGGLGNSDLFLMKFTSAGTRVWGTFYGATGTETPGGVAVDSTGNVIMTCAIGVQNMSTPGVFQTTYGGGTDLLVTKFDSDGMRIWATYLGGSGQEFGGSVATDIFGNVYVTGITASNNFPVSNGAFQTARAGNNDLFIAKFDSAGAQWWATYLGGTLGETSGSIAIDRETNVLVSGQSFSTNFPVTANSYQPTSRGGGDAVIAKFSPFGVRRWATYYGGSNGDWAHGIAADNNLNVAFSAYTNSSDFPVTKNIIQSTYGGGYDAGLVKLDSLGARVWGVYLGGPGSDWGGPVVCDRYGIIFSGTTASRGFRTTPGSFQDTLRGSQDVFIAKFCDLVPRVFLYGAPAVCGGDTVQLVASNNFENYRWSTGDTTRTLTVRTSGKYWYTVDVGGCATSSDTMTVTVHPIIRPTIALTGSAALCTGDSVVLDISDLRFRTVRWSTGDSSRSIVVRTPGRYYANVTDQNGCKSVSDSIIVTLSPKPQPAISPAGPISICSGESVTLDAGANYASYLWSTGDTTRTIVVQQSGDYAVRVTTTGGCAGVAIPVSVTVKPSPNATISANGPLTFCSGGSVTLSVPEGADSYSWSTGETSRSIVVSTTATVSVVASNANGCKSYDTVEVQVVDQPAPRITASGSPNICSGDSITLTADAGYASYSWSTGETTRSIVVRTAGRYSVMASNGDDCKGTSDTLDVTILPRPVAELTGPTSVCTNSSVGYHSSEVADVEFEWSLPDGGTLVAGQGTSQISVRWGAVGTGRVALRMTNRTSRCYVDTVIDVTIGDSIKPTISASGSLQLCEGSTLTLDAGAGYDTYRWSSGESSRTIVVSAPGAYSVSVTTNAGCAGTSAPVTVTALPAPKPTLPAGPLEFCDGDSVAIIAPAGYASYLWSDGVTTDRTLWTKTPGSYYVRVVDQNGCSGTSSSVEVRRLPSPPAPTIAVYGDTLISSVAQSYQWLRDGSPVAGGTNRSLIVSDGVERYRVRVVGDNGCHAISGPPGDGTASATVSIPIIEAVPGDTVMMPIILENSNNLDVAGATRFVATVRFNAALLNVVDSSLFGTTQGNDRIVLINGTRPAGMTKDTLIKVRVVAALRNVLTTPLHFDAFEWVGAGAKTTTKDGELRIKPSGGWSAYLFTGVLSIDAQPNPANTIMLISYETIVDGRVAITLVDALGKSIATLLDEEKKIGRYTLLLDPSGIANGAYFLRMESPAGTIHRKIVVAK